MAFLKRRSYISLADSFGLSLAAALAFPGLGPSSTVGAAASELAAPSRPDLSFKASFASLSLSSSLVSLKLSLIYLLTFSKTLRLMGELVVLDESNPFSLGEL